MFRLSAKELRGLRFQTGTSKSTRGGRRYSPLVFTEQGFAMLSSVLRSSRAVQVNIAIMRTFVHLRELLATHGELRRKIESLEKSYDSRFQAALPLLGTCSILQFQQDSVSGSIHLRSQSQPPPTLLSVTLNDTKQEI